MKNTITYTILLVLAVATIGYSYLNRKHYEDKIWSLDSNLLEMRFALNDIKVKEKVALSTHGIALPDSIMSSLPSDAYILRLHNTICMGCYAENILRLRDALRKEKKGLLILGSYTFDSSLKDEISFIKDKDADIRSMNVPALSIMPADSLELPYVFHLNPQKKIDHVHFFEKQDFSVTQQYLEAIQRLYE